MVLNTRLNDHSETDLYRLDKMVGRRKEIDACNQLIHTPGVQLMVITGEGGIGKTRLMQYLLGSAQNQDTERYVVVPKPIDLYHILNHDKEWFARLLAKSFPEWEDLFPGFKNKLDILDIKRRGGKVKESVGALEEALDVFIQELGEVSKAKKIIFGLDTAERWVYSLRGETRKADAWNWFVQMTSKLYNAIILLAGRDQIDVLAQELILQQIHVQRINLSKFSDKDSKDYLNEVLSNYGPFDFQEDELEALRILSDGKPIILSLALITYRRHGTSELIKLVNQFKAASEAEQGKIVEEFERRIIIALMSDADSKGILDTLGRAPKGADKDLLKIFLGYDANRADEWIRNAKKYVFVKEYEFSEEYKTLAAPRLFLHDRMLELVRKYIYAAPGDNEAKKNAYQNIDRYYGLKIPEISSKLKEIYDLTRSEPSDKKTSPDTKALINEITELESFRAQLYSELVYYSLHNETIKGLKRLVRFTQEAVHTSAPEAIIPLEIELSNYMAGVDQLSFPIRDPELNDFLESLLEILPAYRLYTEHDPEAKLLPEIERFKSKFTSPSCPDNQGCKALLATLLALEGSLRSRQREDVEEIFFTAQKTVDEIDNPSKWMAWYQDYLRGLLAYYLGYDYRNSGLFHKAVEQYQIALKYWGLTKLETPDATTRNDLGFALAEQGSYSDAKENVTKSLEIRKRLGLGRAIGLSRNTLAHIHLRQGNYLEAKNQAQQAKYLFQALTDKYGEGLALIALAEIKRRMVSDEDCGLSLKDNSEYLQEAYNDSREAAEIFDERGLRIPSRQVEALIEVASARRDQVRYMEILGQYFSDDVNMYVEESRQAYSQAAMIAGQKGINYRRLDALVNQVWLEYYIDHSSEGDFKRIQAKIDEVSNETLLTDYTWKTAQLSEKELSQRNLDSTLWVQLGKLHALKGHLALAKYRLKQEDDFLFEATENYFKALKYNSLFGKDYRDMRHAKNAIAREIDQMETDTKKKFATMVIRIESETTPGISLLREYLKNTGRWFD